VKMTGLTEAEGLKTWTPLIAVTGLAGLATSLVLAMVLRTS
jgi:H+/gluconate symporter-like permease